MPKVSLELVHQVLSDNELEPETVAKLLKQIEQQAAAEAEAEAEKAERDPPVKKQFAIILSDPRGTLPDEDYVGWVAQLPEDDPVGATVERVIRAAYEYNISKKGRRYPVKTIGEACEAVGARLFKEQNVAIKNKTPVSVIRTDNKIPEIKSDF